tara:strand:+ start:284 stop:505 length:222 start_codon:yes stop_codon:yes gene_type:complete
MHCFGTEDYAKEVYFRDILVPHSKAGEYIRCRVLQLLAVDCRQQVLVYEFGFLECILLRDAEEALPERRPTDT